MAAIGDIKSDIIDFHNEATSGKLDTTSSEALDTAIQLCLNDLSTSLDALIELDDSIALEAEDNFIDYPTDFKLLVDIVLITSAGVRNAPLEMLQNGQIEYDQLLDNDSANGTPEWYAEYDNGFWLWRPSNGVYDVEIKYYRNHPKGASALTNILFDDYFTDCIKFGTVLYKQLLKSNPKYISIWGPAYANEKEKCRLLLPQEPYIAKGSY